MTEDIMSPEKSTKFQRIEEIQSMFSDNNVIKLDIKTEVDGNSQIFEIKK